MRNVGIVTIISLMFSVVISQTAGAQAIVPTGQTPTLYGGQHIPAGTYVLGGSTGYPETSFDFYMGLTKIFDLAIQPGFTYGRRLDGNRQRLGLDLHVPLRWTLLQLHRLSGGLRAAPYFMIGEGYPSVSGGADVAFLLDIALPSIFKIIVGPEVKTGFASVGDNNRVNGYDGGAWVVLGLETFIAKKFHVGLVVHGGGQWGSGGLTGSGVFRAQLYFGAAL